MLSKTMSSEIYQGVEKMKILFFALALMPLMALAATETVNGLARIHTVTDGNHNKENYEDRNV